MGYVAYLILGGVGDPSAPTARLWLFGALAGAAVLVTVIGVLADRRGRDPTTPQK